MTALTQATAPRAVPLGRHFNYWPLSEYGNESYRQALCAYDLADAVKICTPPPLKAALAKGGWPSFVILETDETARDGKARHVLHFYNVKAKREWRRLGDCGEAVQAAVPYVVHAGSLPMDSFEPRRPFSALTDDHVSGRQPNEPRLIEVRQ